MKTLFRLMFLSLLFLSACGKDEFSVRGRVLYNDRPLEDAEVSVYLKLEKDKERPPVKVVATDKNGFFEVRLKRGKYFLTGRKRLEDQGEIDMLVGSYSDTPIDVKSDLVLKDWTLLSKKNKEDFKKGTGIKGIVKNFKDFRKVRVYAYKDTNSGLKGPDYISFSKIDKDGQFQMDLKEGDFYISVRERKGSFAGPLKEGDRAYDYPNNPIRLTKDKYLDLGIMNLKEVDRKKLEELRKTGYLREGAITIKGVVVDENKKPVKNVYVMIYKDSEMIGRPFTISLPSKEDGTFTITLPEEGKYYVGARTKIGGPAEPGEKIGYIKGSSDKSISVKKGEIKNIIIEVKEIW
ncbi:MAG: hypothetical protein N2999_00450 [Proteobacteria bacterium]|nr:hypothetical protein [Pseudomonadota bacterium]